MPKQLHHFGIHASVVFQLGEDLITDVVQALIELVKNSYDADADYARVEVSSISQNDFPDSRFPNAKGSIVIEDNGIGMNEETIENGWLTISNSLKRVMKKSGQMTDKERTPLGDKGLGRLGVQRLGYNIEIFTKPSTEDFEYHVAWDWRDFQGDINLDEVEVHFVKKASRRRHGTRLVISDLRDAEYWSETGSREQFRIRLAELVSPYHDISNFNINAVVDGTPIEIAEMTDRVRRLAQVRYRIDFDGMRIKIGGKASLNFIRPKDKKGAKPFEVLVDQDEGARFIEYLVSQEQGAAIGLKKSKNQAWFVEFGEEKPFEGIAELRLLDVPVGKKGEQTKKLPANPGPFQAEIDAFDLSRRTANEQSVFDSAKVYRDFIKHLSGVRIYRDGFGVRVDRDWIGLAKQWTGASSYYALKPENTLGYVALSAKHNQCLVETTDREGFKVTPHYVNFLAIFEYFRQFAHDAQEFLRRGWLDFEKLHHREVAEVEPEDSPEELGNRLVEGLARITNIQDSINSVQSQLSGVGESATGVLREAGSVATSSAFKTLKSFIGDLEERLESAQTALEQASEFVDDVNRLRDVSVVLRDEVKSLKDQLTEAYEVVSLGLTSEALSHEINNVADKMALRTSDINKYLAKAKLSDAKIYTYVEYIQTSIAALRKQMAHLAPSLKYVREKREDIDVLAFLQEVKEYHESRWKGESLRIDTKQRSGSDPIHVSMNRGKLMQVFDNLILNSEYWLREQIRKEAIDDGVITLVVSSPFVLVSDNGPGIDPKIENTLFQPFVTRKPKQRGRGLGLFIVAQLLDTEGCSISLSSTRNDDGRLFRFKIDFSGAIDGNQ